MTMTMMMTTTIATMMAGIITEVMMMVSISANVRKYCDIIIHRRSLPFQCPTR